MLNTNHKDLVVKEDFCPVEQPIEVTPEGISDDLWRGRISIRLDLNDSDTTSATRPEPVLVLASRMSYLPVVSAGAVDEFRRFAIDFSSNIWFSADKRPLKR